MPHPRIEKPSNGDNVNLGKAIKSGGDKIREFHDRASIKLAEFRKYTQDLGQDISNGMKKILKENESRLNIELLEKIKTEKEKDRIKSLKGLTKKEISSYLKGLNTSNQLYSVLDTVRYKPTGELDWKFSFEKDGSKYSFHVSCDQESTDQVDIKITKITGNKKENFTIYTRRGETYVNTPLEINTNPDSTTNSPLESDDLPDGDEHVGPTDDYGRKGRFYNGEYLIMAHEKSSKGSQRKLIGEIEITISTVDNEPNYLKTQNLGNLLTFMNSTVLPALKSNAPAKSAKVRAEEKKEQQEEKARQKKYEEESAKYLTLIQKGPSQSDAKEIFNNAAYCVDPKIFLKFAILYKNEEYFTEEMQSFVNLAENAALFMESFANFKDTRNAQLLLKECATAAPRSFSKMVTQLENIDKAMVNQVLQWIFDNLKPELTNERTVPHYNIHASMNHLQGRLYMAYEKLIENNHPTMVTLQKSLPAQKDFYEPEPPLYRD